MEMADGRVDTRRVWPGKAGMHMSTHFHYFALKSAWNIVRNITALAQ